MDKNSNIKLRTSREMPVIGLGTWQLHNNTADAVKNALDLGYRMIDTSGDYGTQPGIAKGLNLSRKSRKDYYIVTKIENYEDAYESAKKNVKELKIEYADLVLVHWPPSSGAGIDLWKGLIKARDECLTVDIGVSNYSVELMEELERQTSELPCVNQIDWTPFGYSQKMLDYCRDKEIVIQSYSPLTHKNKLGDATLGKLAKRHNKTPAQILIRWNLQLGTVPLPKASSIEHQKENIDVFDFELSEEDMDVLNELNEQYASVSSSLNYD